MGFSWDRGPDRLWRKGIDLIGDSRGDDMGEGIEDGTMLGESEGREFLDVTNNGFDDVTPIEQGLQRMKPAAASCCGAPASSGRARGGAISLRVLCRRSLCRQTVFRSDPGSGPAPAACR